MRPTAYNTVLVRPAVTVATRTNGTANGLAVDTQYLGGAFRGVLFVVQSGTMTDGSVAVTMEDSPDGTTWTAVNAAFRQGSLPTIAAANDDTVYEIGYSGTQRYVRLVFVTSGATSGGTFGATAILMGGRRKPPVRS